MTLYPFRIGDIETLVIADASEPMSVTRFNGIFTGVDKVGIQEAFARLDAPVFSRNCLYLKTPTQQILIDTGEGHHANGHFVERLRAAGIDADAIDLIIITHLHLDHFGGMCDVEGKLVFPQARVTMARAEWAYWMDEATLTDERRQILHQTFDAYEQAGQIDLVEDGQEITPGIRAVLMAGHTPGHMGLRITSGEDALLHIADAAHFPLQSQYLRCYTRYDVEPEQSMTTRRVVFERAANERVLTLAFHFPFPGLGYVTHDKDVFGWQPVG